MIWKSGKMSKYTCDFYLICRNGEQLFAIKKKKLYAFFKNGNCKKEICVKN